MSRFLDAWKRAMVYPGDYSKRSQVEVGLEQIRRLKQHIT